jgi:hypothetical protein
LEVNTSTSARRRITCPPHCDRSRRPVADCASSTEFDVSARSIARSCGTMWSFESDVCLRECSSRTA